MERFIADTAGSTFLYYNHECVCVVYVCVFHPPGATCTI